jgi:predicted kinase
MNSVLFLMVGNVGAGKTTTSLELQSQFDAVHIDFDKIGQECGFDIYNQFNIHEFNDKINKIFYSSIDSKCNIIIDGNLIQKSNRKHFIFYAKSNNYFIKCYDFGIGKQEHLYRRAKLNQEKTLDEWTEIFNGKKILYEKPTNQELIDLIIEK